MIALDEVAFAEVLWGALDEDDPKAGRSALHKHMVRAVYYSLRKRGDDAKGAAKGAFRITGAVLKNNGYQGKGDAGKLTGKGATRSRAHAGEKEHGAKAADYDAVRRVATGK